MFTARYCILTAINHNRDVPWPVLLPPPFWGGWRAVGTEFASHEKVNHGKDEYVRGAAHSNTVEGFFAILKRGVVGTFHHVSEAHFSRYLREFDFRYSNRLALGINDTMRTDEALRGIGGKRLTYRRVGQAAYA